MLNLNSSTKIQKELKNYRLGIEKILNEDVRSRAFKLLDRLRAELMGIDQAHNPRNTKAIDPRTARDNIKRSVDLRIELDKIIKDSK
jgi:hypothetical protein